jgi:alkylation response protein AidB-like acyl-CoA dehydrogenase
VDDADVAAIIAAVRTLVRERVVPLEAWIDENDEMPQDLVRAAAQMGLYGFAIPEAYGGLGLSMAQEARLEARTPRRASGRTWSRPTNSPPAGRAKGSTPQLPPR